MTDKLTDAGAAVHSANENRKAVEIGKALKAHYDGAASEQLPDDLKVLVERIAKKTK